MPLFRADEEVRASHMAVVTHGELLAPSRPIDTGTASNVSYLADAGSI